MKVQLFTRRGLCLFVQGVLWAALAGHAWGNAPAPPVDRYRFDEPDLSPQMIWLPALVEEASFVVRHEAAQEHSQIIIPRKCLPFQYSVPQTSKQSLSSPQKNATYAGMLLTTVLSGGGLTVVLARRRRVGAAATTLLGVLIVAVAIGTAMAAPVLESPAPTIPASPSTPPPSPHLPDQRLPPKWDVPYITVEVTETGDEIVLILGKNASAIGPRGL